MKISRFKTLLSALLIFLLIGQGQVIYANSNSIDKISEDNSLSVSSGVYDLEDSYLNLDNKWNPLQSDTKLRNDNSNPAFTYSLQAKKFKVRLNNKVDKQAVSFSVADRTVSYRAQNMSNVAGTVENNILTYRNAWESTDLKYVIQADKMKMELHLANEQAPKSYSFALSVANVTYSNEFDGSIGFYDENGELAFRIPKPWVKDSSSDNYRYDKVQMKMRTEGKITFLDLILDDSGLQYPLIVDPTTTIPQFGSSHTLRIKSDGTVWAWGTNYSGQLGNGTTVESSTPVQVSGLTNVIDVAAAEELSLALKGDGTVWAWGNLYNLTGGSFETTTPVQIAGLSNVVKISAKNGNGHALALKQDGTVWAWGLNESGQLGDGTTADHYVPAPVSGLSNVSAIIASNEGSIALKNDGTVWTWGGMGTLGTGSTNPSLVPVKVTSLSNVISVDLGQESAAALLQNGTVWTWGSNRYGELGNSVSSGSLTPVQVTGLTGATKIIGGSHHYLVLKQNGSVWGWGRNSKGQLGNGTTSSKNITPVEAQSLTTVTSIHAGGLQSGAVTSDGSFWAWGENVASQYGAGSTSQTTPLLFIPANDTQAPTKPGPLTMTASTPTSITLSWGASTDNVGVAGYDIYNGTVVIDTVPGTMTSKTVLLQADMLYVLTVKARDMQGNISPASNSVTYNTDNTPPTAPTVKLGARTASSVTLEWTPSYDQSGVAGYEIYKGNALIDTVSGTTTSYLVSNLTENSIYSFKVRAYDTSNHFSDYSNILQASPDVTAPSALSVRVSYDISFGFFVSWVPPTDASGITKYEIYFEDQLVKEIKTSESTSTLYQIIRTFQANHDYNFKVKAYDYGNNVTVGSFTRSTDLTPPTVPGALQVTNRSANSISLSWTASTDNRQLKGYLIYSGSSNVDPIKQVDHPLTTAVITGLAANQIYNFRVAAIDTDGNISSVSNEVKGSTDMTPPSVPSGLTVTNRSSTGFTVSWQASTDNLGVAGYQVSILDTITQTTTTKEVVTPSIQVSNLEANKMYRVSVKAYDGSNNVSNASPFVNASTDITAPIMTGTMQTTARTSTSVTVTWPAATDNIGVEAYQILKGNVLVATLNANQSSYMFSGLPSNDGFIVTIQAVDAAGNIASNPLTLRTGTDLTPPSAPTSLVVISRSATSVKLGWSPSTDNVGISEYHIFNNGLYVVTVPSANAFYKEYTLTGLSENTIFNFTVKGMDYSGNLSQASNSVKVGTDFQKPDIPSSLEVKSHTASTVTLRWGRSLDNVGVTSYDIYLGTTLLGTVAEPVGTIDYYREFKAINLEENKKYTFKVVAKDESGNVSDGAEIIAITDVTKPSAPTKLVVTQVGNKYKLEWGASTDNFKVEFYRVYYGDDVYKMAYANTSSYEFSSSNGSNYKFSIRAIDESGNISDPSNQVTAISTDNVVTYVYDSRGRLQYILFADGKKIYYDYDDNGNLIRIRT
ncbi:fibronectin type III domain-containing protein [Cohnella sp. GCM10012308]|uniref:RCC1 domain-containing protein n=1 Tax=Cohnella sp. GCM10012308 TaxID=3317329 RepID=UPI0036239FC8